MQPNKSLSRIWDLNVSLNGFEERTLFRKRTHPIYYICNIYVYYIFIYPPPPLKIVKLEHIAKLSPVQNIAQFKSCSQFVQSYFHTNKTSFM